MSRKRNIEGENVETISESHTLYVNNLNDKILPVVLKHSLYVYFSTYGDIIDIVLKAKGKMRGQAHIVFANINHASNAMRELQGKQFFLKDLHIEYALKKSKIVSDMEEENNI